MDFAFLALAPLAAVTAAVRLVGAALLDKPDAGWRAPFLLIYATGVAFMAPWSIASWQDAGGFAFILLVLLFWTSAGCAIGCLVAAAVICLGARLGRLRNS